MINTNISLNNKSYTLDGHYGKYSEPRGDEEEFIIKLFPLDESIIIHNDYIMIACRIIKNDNVNLFLIITKSEGFCASYSVIAYNNYILNEYVFTEESTDVYKFTLLNYEEITQMKINRLQENNFVSLDNYIKSNI